MKIIDITRSLSERTVTFPGDCPPVFVQRDAGQYLISELRMSSHAGTHIDAPVHYLKTGDTIDSIPLDHVIGTCRVLDVTAVGNAITAEHLAGRIDGAARVLLKTWFSGRNKAREDFPHLTPDAARLITRHGIRCVGIDSLSIEAFSSEGSVHRELLGHGCTVVELIDLSGVGEGEYEMIALPLRLERLDGSPARVILIDREGE